MTWYKMHAKLLLLIMDELTSHAGSEADLAAQWNSICVAVRWCGFCSEGSGTHMGVLSSAWCPGGRTTAKPFCNHTPTHTAALAIPPHTVETSPHMCTCMHAHTHPNRMTITHRCIVHSPSMIFSYSKTWCGSEFIIVPFMVNGSVEDHAHH